MYLLGHLIFFPTVGCLLIFFSTLSSLCVSVWTVSTHLSSRSLVPSLTVLKSSKVFLVSVKMFILFLIFPFYF